MSQGLVMVKKGDRVRITVGYTIREGIVKSVDSSYSIRSRSYEYGLEIDSEDGPVYWKSWTDGGRFELLSSS